MQQAPLNFGHDSMAGGNFKFASKEAGLPRQFAQRAHILQLIVLWRAAAPVYSCPVLHR